jgi:hypothetical protein
MKCSKHGIKMKKVDLRFVSTGPYKFAYECSLCDEERRKEYERTSIFNNQKRLSN